MKYQIEKIGINIKKERENNDWTQAQLGQKLGYKEGQPGKQISLFERGKCIPSLDILLDLCEIFNCELGYLLGESSYTDKTLFYSKIKDLTGIDSSSIETLKGIHYFNNKYLDDNEEPLSITLNSFIGSEEFYNILMILHEMKDKIYNLHDAYIPLEVRYGVDKVQEAKNYISAPVKEEFTVNPQFDFEEIVAISEEIENYDLNKQIAMRDVRREVFDVSEEFMKYIFKCADVHI